MRKILGISLSSILLFCGCYTILRHPEIEAYYEDANHEQTYAEEFDVVVDEDCSSCHTDFRITRHFAPFSPAHHDVWSQTPWWFDDNYKAIFGSPTPKDNGEYDSSESTVDMSAPAKSPPAYIRSPRTPEGTTTSRIGKSLEADSTQNSSTRNETERKTSESSRRKFRKRN
jgi:hypothetical protein